jgi:hypothetical protein
MSKDQKSEMEDDSGNVLARFRGNQRVEQRALERLYLTGGCAHT